MIKQYFGSVAAGATEIIADNTGSKVTIAAGNDIAVSANAATATVTISVNGVMGDELPVVQDDNTNATNYVVFNAATSGFLAPKVDSGLYYNPATGILSVTGIRFGDASIASTASEAFAVANFSFNIAGDDSTQRIISLNETVKFTGAGGITTASDTEGNITITGPSLAGLATETFVTTRGYITSSALIGLAGTASTYSFNVAADDSTLREISTDETVKFIGAGGITTASDAEGNITITATSTPTITGGTINNAVIGGTTPAAGSFTTLIGGSDSANYGQLTGGATTKAVEFKSLGTDTNVAYAIQSKGTGAIDLAAGSSGVNISNGGTVTAITKTVSGTGFTVMPTVTIAVPTTAGGVQATANITALVATATINNGASTTTASFASAFISNGTSGVAGTILTVRGSTTGTPVVGYFLTGSGVTAGTTISAINSATFVGTLNGTTTLTYSSGTVPTVGMAITGTSVTAGTYIVSGTSPTFTLNQSATGTPTTGTSYTVNTSQAAATAASPITITATRPYTVNEVLTVQGGTGTPATITASGVTNGIITSVTIATGGSYTVIPGTTPTVTGGTSGSTGAILNITYGVNTLAVNAAGSGYVEQPAVTFGGTGGSAAAAYVTVGSDTSIRSMGNNLLFNAPNGTVLRLADNSLGAITGYLQIGNAQGNGGLTIQTNGTNANTPIFIGTGASGNISFFTGSSGTIQARISATASAINYVNLTGSAIGTGVTVSALGTDTNIDVIISPKGTGKVSITSTTASTSTTTGALVVAGGLGVNGAVNALTKSFIIPHPTKPGKLLKHGSLEGPEFGVYVRGKLIDGRIIKLPDYWLGLVDQDTITVDLTPIGKFQKLYVEKIEGNKIYIDNGSMFGGNVACFYTVWGERKDVSKLDIEVDE
jgi:hypothetical protein